MSGFLEFLRCILCCVEDQDNDIENYASWETRHLLSPSDIYSKFRVVLDSGSSNSSNNRPQSSTTYTTSAPWPNNPPTSYSRLPQSSSSSSPKPSRPQLSTSYSNQSPSRVISDASSSKPFPLPSSPQAPLPPTSASKQPKPSLSLPKATTSSLAPPSPSSKALPTHKVTLSTASSIYIDQQSKANYVVQKVESPIYAIPKDIQDLIKKDKVPHILEMPLCPSTYKDYFASLLYAEDFEIEKWKEFKLFNVTLKLQEALVYKKSGKSTLFSESNETDDKTFVVFEIDSARENRPFLLSRDFVIARPSDKNTEFKGVIYRVLKSTQVLVEFGEDFHLQHRSSRKYDISFSFNRVCLKRAHQAVDAASDPSFRSFIFPECASRKSIPASPHLDFCNHKLDVSQKSAIRQILCFQGSPPYLIEGSLCVNKKTENLSSTGLVVKEAVLQIYQRSAKNRILICAPINRTCDVLMRSLMEEIRESDMFRANAAFREIDGVPIDILSSCRYKGECFTCPSLHELRKFRVISSTFVSSFRLHNEGILAGHFSHIFTVDASSAIEPEAMIALANLADEKTAVIVTGAPGNRSGWVRSDIARDYGLSISYFERLRKSKLYESLDPVFITKLVDTDQESDDSCSSVSYY